MPELQSAEFIRLWMADHPDWSGDTDQITRDVEAPTFLDGIALVTAVAAVAENMDHHPDIDIRWRTSTFRLSTHSAGGVTELDLDLAGHIDTLVNGLGHGTSVT